MCNRYQQELKKKHQFLLNDNFLLSRSFASIEFEFNENAKPVGHLMWLFDKENSNIEARR